MDTPLRVQLNSAAAPVVSCSSRSNNHHRQCPFYSVCLKSSDSSCMSCSNSLWMLECCFASPIDTLWCCCAFFLSSFHLFFLPLAWVVGLAVQGCKYHCALFSALWPSCHTHQGHLVSCWSVCCMKDFSPSLSPSTFNTSLWNLDLIQWSVMRKFYHRSVDVVLFIEVPNKHNNCNIRVFASSVICFTLLCL